MIEEQAGFLPKRGAIVAMARRTLVLAIAIAAACLCLSGCGKSRDAADNASAPASSPQAVQGQTQAEMPANAVQPMQPSPGSPANAEPLDLNRELRKWIVKNRRPPKNFDDFASTSGIEIPPPPDGKRYAIDKTMHVILVKR